MWDMYQSIARSNDQPHAAHFWWSSHNSAAVAAVADAAQASWREPSCKSLSGTRVHCPHGANSCKVQKCSLSFSPDKLDGHHWFLGEIPLVCWNLHLAWLNPVIKSNIGLLTWSRWLNHAKSTLSLNDISTYVEILIVYIMWNHDSARSKDNICVKTPPYTTGPVAPVTGHAGRRLSETETAPGLMGWGAYEPGISEIPSCKFTELWAEWGAYEPVNHRITIGNP